MTRAFLVAVTAYAVVFLIPFGAEAQTCAERCDAAYENCASLEAAGCEIGGQLAGDAAQQLGNEVPIPGMGALFGALARGTATQKCVELLGPCKQIRTTCLAGCPAGDGVATGDVAAPAARYSTLRIFSDHPRAIVYINEQRMGATPEDVLEPFISPDMRVGRYWVRLTTPDGEWEWRGEKTVEEGNINAVEGNLTNRRLRLIDSARALDAAGETVRAAGVYREFQIAFPSDEEDMPQVEARLAVLAPLFEAADAEMFRRIQAEEEPQKRAALCRVYLDEFASGAHRAEAETALAQAENAFPRPRQPGDPAPSPVDDRAQVEAVVGKDLRRPYAQWQTVGSKRYPKFSDYAYYYYKNRRTTAIVLTVTYSVTFVAGGIAGAVLIPKGLEEDNETYVVLGGAFLGVTSAFFLGSIIIGPIVGHIAKENMRKLEAAGMGTTALRSPRLKLVGLGPIADARANVSGLALNWKF